MFPAGCESAEEPLGATEELRGALELPRSLEERSHSELEPLINDEEPRGGERSHS